MDNLGMTVRQKVWLDAWIAIAASSSCVKVEVPSNWADTCLREFDKRFSQQKEPTNV